MPKLLDQVRDLIRLRHYRGSTSNWTETWVKDAFRRLGRVPATGIMRTLQVGANPTQLVQAIAEFGRIDKTPHIYDEQKRRAR